MENGREAGTPIDAGSAVQNIAVSQHEKWIVSGTLSGLVTVWNAESYSKVTEWKAHDNRVYALDVSPDRTRIATGSDDGTLCVWSLSTGERLLGPFKHDHWVVAVKFSPDGHFVATGTWQRDSVRVYDSHWHRHLRLAGDFPVQVGSTFNQSLTWASDSKQLFALSRDGNIHCLDISAGTALSKWAIHSTDKVKCIALASNGTFLAASAHSSISFWDTATREQIGAVMKHTHFIRSMAISASHSLAIGGQYTITLRGLCDILPYRYSSEESTENLERTVQALYIQLADCQQKAGQVKDSLDEIIKSLGAKEESSSVSIASLAHLSLKFKSTRYRNRASQANCPGTLSTKG